MLCMRLDLLGHLVIASVVKLSAMILLRCASDALTDLDFENNSRIACCFSLTMTFAALPGIVYCPLKLVKECRFHIRSVSSNANAFQRH